MKSGKKHFVRDYKVISEHSVTINCLGQILWFGTSGSCVDQQPQMLHPGCASTLSHPSRQPRCHQQLTKSTENFLLLPSWYSGGLVSWEGKAHLVQQQRAWQRLLHHSINLPPILPHTHTTPRTPGPFLLLLRAYHSIKI